MKKLYAIAAALCFGVAAYAQSTYSVTFELNLGSTTANTNGVHIAGSFQGWQPDTTELVQVGTSNWYSVTRQLAAGDHEYKFINGSSWTDAENVPAENQVNALDGSGNGNRWLRLRCDTTIQMDYSGNSPNGANFWVIQVDLNKSNIDSALITSNLLAAGPIVLDDFGNDGKWEIIWFDDAPNMLGSSLQFTGYSNGSGPYYTSVTGPQLGATGGVSDTVISVCWNSTTACPYPKYDITLNIDVSSISTCGTVDSVTVAGTGPIVNGWGGDLMSDPDGDGIWSITYYDVDSGDFEFKARYHENGNTNWEGGGNKIFTASSDSIVATRCFGNDNYGPCPTIPATADVTFIVDFTQASYTPADSIFLIGNFTQWGTNPIYMAPHTTAGQYIATVPSFCPGTMEYRFSNGDASNSANHEPVDSACGVDNGVGGYNRFFARTGSADTLRHTYGTCSFVGIEEGALDFVTVHPNPMTESTTIGLGLNDRYTVRVMDITGRVVAGFDNVQGDVELVRNNMVSGMYYVNITDANGATKTLKVVVE